MTASLRWIASSLSLLAMTNASRERVIASQRTRAKSRGPMTGSAKQARAACDDREAALDCFVAIALAMTKAERNKIALNRMAIRSDKSIVSRVHARDERFGRFGGSLTY